MMHVPGLLVKCMLLTAVCMGTEWLLDDTQDSELSSRALWAEQLSLSLLPAYSLASDPTPDFFLCAPLLYEFANNSASLSNCLVSMARPVRLCQRCYMEYTQLKATMSKIGNPLQNSTVSCSTILLQSDRVQVIVSLSGFFDDLWTDSKCENCLQKNSTGILNSTSEFMDSFDSLIQCFNNTMREPPVPSQQGNYSRVCQSCNGTYKYLNNLYNNLEHTNALCIDIEDAMNGTRKLWSKTFNCTLPCTDTVPVIAVSAFILFLPVVFYLSSFLHSEQKKRKLILPKRFKSGANVANIQDKRN
ncbi:osteopetrosis-associated transmembrane protein 1 [Hyla sarda]|uniref:osteopetrosis-associated transmembrane protein 1 n=1 Tax=Hyla sarda TaxID=327740 RepID=UPI0024C22FD0|nr:osteopetrosis-associated transmembrane protein 1 [Hyla sarda]